MAASTPATSSASSSSATKVPSSTKSGPSKQTKQKRNERERKRVDQVNQGFILLQERVPKTAGSKAKLSKVETLREAARYIQQLQKQLGYMAPVDFPTPEQSPIYPQSMCSMPPQTPSPSYMSPYYPTSQMMPTKQEMGSAQYYQENASSSSAADAFFSNGEAY